MIKKDIDEQHYQTSDIALAAYLKLKGLKLIQCNRDGKFNFLFEDPNGKAEDLAFEFVNSDIRKYDDEIRSGCRPNLPHCFYTEANPVFETASPFVVALIRTRRHELIDQIPFRSHDLNPIVAHTLSQYRSLGVVRNGSTDVFYRHLTRRSG